MQSHKRRFVEETDIRYLKRACITLESCLIEHEGLAPNRVYSQPFPVPVAQALASTERIVESDWSPITPEGTATASTGTAIDIGSGAIHSENERSERKLPTTEDKNRPPPEHCLGKPDIRRNPKISSISGRGSLILPGSLTCPVPPWRLEVKTGSSHPVGMASPPLLKPLRIGRTIGS